jgi:hypothetical protein
MFGVVAALRTQCNDDMLRILTSLNGRRLAAWLVALAYLAGVVTPSAALAFGDGAASAYCFDEIAEQVAAPNVQVHVHADGTVHHHADHTTLEALQKDSERSQNPAGSQDHTHDADCCGAFGFAAVLPAQSVPIAGSTAFHVRLPILTECLVGCRPDRIDRPPIVLLSM